MYMKTDFQKKEWPFGFAHEILLDINTDATFNDLSVMKSKIKVFLEIEILDDTADTRGILEILRINECLKYQKIRNLQEEINQNLIYNYLLSAIF